MPRFFTDLSAVKNDRIIIDGEDAHHIMHVLRMRIGESVTVCVPENGLVYQTVLEKIDREVCLRIVSTSLIDTEPPYRAVIYQALVRGEKMDTVIQKAVETGAAQIVPVLTERCMVRWDAKDGVRKLERWQRIAAEAAKQCGRGILPVVSQPMRLADVLIEAGSCALPLFCYEGEAVQPLPQCMAQCSGVPEQIAVVIGPEGGFTPEEAAAAKNAGFQMCGLGKRILRTETAAIFVLSCLSQTYELSQMQSIQSQDVFK